MTSTGTAHTIRDLLGITTDFLKQRGVESARLDAEVLLAHVLGVTRIHLYVNFDEPLQVGEVDSYRSVVRERARRVPLAYIVGSKEFMSLDFCVGPGVLIPRPDTETLVEEALQRLPQGASLCIADVGTGSGAIAISIAAARPEARVFALDISPEALAFASHNVERHGLGERVRVIPSDLFAGLEGVISPGGLDAIVSNPPYVESATLQGLQPEVAVHEPRLALDGGPDGQAVYRRLVVEASHWLKAGGFLALEVGAGQATFVADIVALQWPRASIAVARDLAGVDRVVVATDGN